VVPFEGSADSLAPFSQVGQVPAGDSLDKDVAQGSGFHRTRHNRPLAGIGGELAKQPIAKTTSYHTDDVIA
jgi:hypothetical protein